MAERTLPHNLEAEKCVLGAILIDNPSFNQAAEVIDAGDFFRDAHRRILEKLIGLSERSQPIDPGLCRFVDRRRPAIGQRRVLREDR